MGGTLPGGTPGPGDRGAQGGAKQVYMTVSRGFKVMLLAFVVLQSDVHESEYNLDSDSFGVKPNYLLDC